MAARRAPGGPATRPPGLVTPADWRAHAQAVLTGIAGHAGRAVVAVLAVDLDHLKEVNDALGHQTGDALLHEAAVRLVTADAGPATRTVTRTGGDEFLVVQVCPDDAAARRVLDTLRRALCTPVAVGDVDVPLRASIGMAVGGTDGRSLDDLVAAADRAMYASKRDATAPGLRTLRGPLEESPDLVADLRRALDQPERQELYLQYQPQVSPDGRILGFEALVRWAHPRIGQLTPAGFLALAEQHGLVARLDQLVIGLAAADLGALVDGTPGTTVSVNLSAHGLLNSDLAAALPDLLAPAGAERSRLTLEVSEAATGLGRLAVPTYDALRTLGCGLSVHDFGSARASLAALGHDPLVREVKLHPRLVAGLAGAAPDDATPRQVRAVISAAHALGLRVVGEGVETAAVADALADLGCDALQGFWVAPPMAALDLLDWAGFWRRTRPAVRTTLQR